jgi:hypothetical protein
MAQGEELGFLAALAAKEKEEQEQKTPNSIGGISLDPPTPDQNTGEVDEGLVTGGTTVFRPWTSGNFLAQLPLGDYQLAVVDDSTGSTALTYVIVESP